MRKQGIFYGWWIVLAASLMHFWGAGTFYYSFTAFFNPLVQEFQWSYAATSFAASFRSLETGIVAPVAGFLVDKFGPRRLILIGAVIGGIGGLWLSRISSLWSFYAAFILFSIGSSLMHPLPGITAVAHWFSRRRGTVMGILVAAAGASGVLIPFINWLIAQYGWRVAFVIVGAGTWLIGIPLSLVIRHRPEQYGYRPDGGECLGRQIETPGRQRETRVDGEGSGLGVRQATKTSAFWMLTVVSTVSSAAVQAVTVHVMPCLISVGVPRDVASSIAASVVISSVAGRLGFGWLGDRVNKRYLLASSLLLQALGLIVFAHTRNLAYAIAFLALYGPGFGGVIIVRLALQADYFGRKAFGSIQGLIQGMHLAGTIISPVFAGWVYDVQGSYQWAWLVLAMAVFLSIPLALLAKPPKQ